MKFLEQLIKAGNGENVIIDYSLIKEGVYGAIPIDVKHDPDAVNKDGVPSARLTVKYQLSQEGVKKEVFSKAEYYQWFMDESRDLGIRTRMLTQLVIKLISFGILDTEKFTSQVGNFVGDDGFVEVPENLTDIIESSLGNEYREKNILIEVKEDKVSGRKNNEFRITQ